MNDRCMDIVAAVQIHRTGAQRDEAGGLPRIEGSEVLGEAQRAGAAEGGRGQDVPRTNDVGSAALCSCEAGKPVHLAEHVGAGEHDVVRSEGDRDAVGEEIRDWRQAVGENRVGSSAADDGHPCLGHGAKVIAERVREVHKLIGLGTEDAAGLRLAVRLEAGRLGVPGFGDVAGESAVR